MAENPDTIPESKDCKPAKYCKPVLKGYLRRNISFNIMVALISAAASGAAYQYFIVEKRKKNYAAFYRDYDAEEEFKIMKKKKGLFQSG
ncbi:hypothetical protein GE061_010310 [Apolygus lucorum]|uniref:Uncharacterized protein n=1 Tax=Apolygus lucorum TaxID=248454 RepID=A0A6A4K3X3_APOLU|nr:hypothetical protein GE061_010310 [Apolygus lucorum]